MRFRPVARVKARVQGAVGVQPRQVVPYALIDPLEVAADDQAPVAISHDGVHRIVRAPTRVKGGIERAVGVQPNQVPPLSGAYVVKLPTSSTLPPGR